MKSLATAPGGVFLSEEEEPASPPTIIAPTQQRERIYAIDVLRGTALLGILMANIEDFAIPELGHDIPIGMPKPPFVGPHAHLHLIIVTLKWMLIEGKMRALFSMLFGAGVIMMTRRAERRGAGQDIADTYLRRNMWLVLFGLLHACLIWYGDILVWYGLTALLFLYPCRKLGAETLICSGTFITLSFATLTFFPFAGGSIHDFSLSKQAAIVESVKHDGKSLTLEQQQIEAAWQARVNTQIPTQQSIDASMANTRVGYFDGIANRIQFLYLGPGASGIQLFLVTDALGAMLLGMGLFKTGFLSGEKSYATYIWTAAIGFLISQPLYILGMWKTYRSGFYLLTTEKWLIAPYYVTRESGSLAIAAFILILVKSGTLRWLQALLAAVGRTALSNYLLTSILCQLIFQVGPWKLYGRLEYYQIHFVVFAIWAINLTISPLWLRVFQFGPIEWLWRSLTYLKLQPMKIQ
jgi:uncharacterized protein